MILIVLAISLTIALCFIALRFAVFAMPFMVGLSAFRAVSAPDSGWLLPTLAAAAAFAIPAMIAGYALMHGLAKNALDPGVGLTLLCGVAGVCVGVATVVNLSAVGEVVFGS